MNINLNVTIGFTPEASKILQGLSQLVHVTAENQETISSNNVQSIQSVPAQQVPTQQPTAVPTAPANNQQPVYQNTYTPAQPAAVPTSEVTYTIDQLAVAATQLVDAGKRDELLQLLSEFGVQALTALPRELYGAFATKLREKGAKI